MAEKEGREFTPEEKATYDQNMAEGRSVAEQLKQQRHDESVFAFAKDLSENVIGGLGGSPGGLKSGQRLNFAGMGRAAADKIRAGADGDGRADGRPGGGVDHRHGVIDTVGDV